MSNLNGGLSGSGTLRGTLGGGGVPAQDVYWDDILNKPNFAAVATSGSYNDLTNKPTLSTVATSGSYNDLTDKPTIPAAQVNADWNATSGVAEILNKPTIPPAQVNADWNAASGVAEILNKPTIPTTASQIDYDNTTSGLQADDVQDAITELKSNLTNLPESGSNANGNYMKFPDGTLICTKTVTVSVSYSAWGSCYESNSIDLGALPMEFYSAPVVTLNLNNSSSSGWIVGCNPTTTALGNTRCIRPNAGASSQNITIGIIAIGRWKA